MVRKMSYAGAWTVSHRSAAGPLESAPTTSGPVPPDENGDSPELRIDPYEPATTDSLDGSSGRANPSGKKRRTGRVLVAGAAVAGLAVGGAYAASRNSQKAAPTPVTQATAGARTASPSGSASKSSASSPNPTRDPILVQQRAQRQLVDFSRRDLAQTKLKGQWAAQLAFRNEGVRDPVAVTRSGSPIFAFTDILAEHQALRKDSRFGGNVILLQSTSFGNGTEVKGKPSWVTLAQGKFASSKAVDAWCSKKFPKLKGEKLKGACSARTLRALARVG